MICFTMSLIIYKQIKPKHTLNRLVLRVFLNFTSLKMFLFIFSNINRVISIIEAEKLNQSFFYPKIEKINNLIIESNYRENGNEE